MRSDKIGKMLIITTLLWPNLILTKEKFTQHNVQINTHNHYFFEIVEEIKLRKPFLKSEGTSHYKAFSNYVLIRSLYTFKVIDRTTTACL